MPTASQRPHRVEILAFADAQILDVTGPAQVFATANDLGTPTGPRLYEIALVSLCGDVATSSGLLLRAEAATTRAKAPGTLIVSGGYGVNAARRDEALIRWIRQRASLAERTASVCSGAFLLAAAGLLDHKRATTHWLMFELMGRCFPAVRIDRDAIFVQHGAIWTSAGVTAGIDLAMAMVEADCGHEVAMEVARELVVYLKRPGGQSQFSGLLQAQVRDSAATFDELNRWIVGNLARADLDVEALAARAGMSPRNFARVYKERTGRTPARAVQVFRVEAARRLLENTDGPVDRIAQRCGFGDEERMRVTFQRHLGVAPRDYRRRFAARDAPSST